MALKAKVRRQVPPPSIPVSPEDSDSPVVRPTHAMLTVPETGLLRGGDNLDMPARVLAFTHAGASDELLQGLTTHEGFPPTAAGDTFYSLSEITDIDDVWSRWHEYDGCDQVFDDLLSWLAEQDDRPF